MSSNTNCGRSVKCMLQLLLFTVLCKIFGSLEKKYPLLLLSGMRSYMHATWTALQQRPWMQTCYCLLTKQQRTGTHLVTQVANHFRDNVVVDSSTLYMMFTIPSFLPLHLMVLFHTMSLKAQLTVHVFCISYRNMSYVWCIFRLIKIADGFKCLLLPHILDCSASVLIMDNCHIHLGKEVHVLIEDMHHSSSIL